jgi:hypothetical protein
VRAVFAAAWTVTVPTSPTASTPVTASLAATAAVAEKGAAEKGEKPNTVLALLS